jgi:uncharacterized membrane protein YeiH
MLGTVTGIGGGTIRDLLLGAPVFWVGKPGYLVACIVVSALVFSTAHLLESRFKVLLWLDAIGMALFAVVGAEIASLAGANGIVAVTMGVITATFGGIIRDLLGGEVPIILSREIYASAALAGAASFVVLMTLVASRELALGVSFAVAFVIRAAALELGWSLPRYRPRPARRHDHR